MKNSINNTLIRELNSQLSQVVVVPRHSEYVFTDRTVLLHFIAKELVGDFISLNPGISFKYIFRSWNISYAPWSSKCFWSPGSKL